MSTFFVFLVVGASSDKEFKALDGQLKDEIIKVRQIKEDYFNAKSEYKERLGDLKVLKKDFKAKMNFLTAQRRCVAKFKKSELLKEKSS